MRGTLEYKVHLALIGSIYTLYRHVAKYLFPLRAVFLRSCVLDVQYGVCGKNWLGWVSRNLFSI